MKNGIRIIAALSMVFSAMIGTNVAIKNVAARTVTQCGCGNASCDGGCGILSRHRQKKACRNCNSDCGCVQCPSCADEICKLELDQSKVKKTCFKVEQKPICVPPVRFPWMKSCPPGTSKTKLVKVLSTHSFECPNCAYKWKLQECEPLQEATPTPAATEQATVIPAPPIYEVRHPNQNQPWRPAVRNGTNSAIVVAAEK